MKTNRNIHTSSCLQCNPCGSGCTIVDNRISFVFDSEKKHFSHLLFDPTPVACMGRCGRSCQAGFRLVQEAKYRTTSVEQLKTISRQRKEKIKELEIKSNILTEEFDKLKLENEDLKRQVEEKEKRIEEYESKIKPVVEEEIEKEKEIEKNKVVVIGKETSLTAIQEENIDKILL